MGNSRYQGVPKVKDRNVDYFKVSYLQEKVTKCHQYCTEKTTYASQGYYGQTNHQPVRLPKCHKIYMSKNSNQKLPQMNAQKH